MENSNYLNTGRIEATFYGVDIRFKEKVFTDISDSTSILETLHLLEQDGLLYIKELDPNWKEYPPVSIKDYERYLESLNPGGDNSQHPPKYGTAWEYTHR